MQLSTATLYALRLSLSQGAPSVLRKSMVEKSTATSAVFLATLGLSMSIFSLKQMLASSANHRLRRYH